VTADTVALQAKPFDHSTVRREAHAGDLLRVMGETAGMEGDGKAWWVTTEGYVPRETLAPADEAVRATWTLPSAEDAPNGWWGEVSERARVRTEPMLDAPVVGFLQPGARVKVLDEQEGEPIDGSATWYRIDGGRYAGGMVHGSTVARIAPPAASNAPREALGEGSGLLISRGEKTLTLVQSGNPIFTTYVALGRASLDTPTGEYRVLEAYPRDDMSSDRNAEAAESYSLTNIPWTLYFKEGGYAIHGTYWHDAFGTDQSEGCVNLTVTDAGYLYDQLGASGARGTPILIVD
jgi:hypothetical protein